MSLLLMTAGGVSGGGSSPSTITIDPQNISDFETGTTATAYYELHSDGYVYQTTFAGTDNIGQWCNPAGNAANYEAYATTSVGALTTGTTNTWLSLGSNRVWGVQRASPGARGCTIVVGVRLIGGDGTILDSNDINLYAEYD